MLRKVGLISALMLALPAFANAWTITAKVGSGAGTITSDSAAGTVTRTAADKTAIVGYFKVDNSDADQVITIAPTSGYAVSSVIVDGLNVTAKDAQGNVILTYTIASGTPAKNHTVVVYYTAVTYKVSVTQVPNGVVTVQALSSDATPKVIGAYSVKEIANLKSGAKVRITASPNADYKVTNVAGDAISAQYAGVAYSKDVTVTGNATYTAAFALVPSVVANIYTNSLNGTVGVPITVKASAVANGPVTYAFTSSEPAAITASGATATYTPATAGAQTVTVTATSNGATSSKTLTFNIQSVAQNSNDVCTSCHAQRDTLIVAGFNASSHKSTTKHVITCSDCHTPSADSHATRSTYVVYSGASIKAAAGCQACHTPGKKWGVYSSNFVLKAPHGGGQYTYGGGSNGAQDNAGQNLPAAKTQYVAQGMICQDCHGHNNIINGEFAEGGHGEISDDPMNAFVHYDWNKRTNDGTRSNGNCDRCHSTYGFLKFANATSGLTRLQLKSNQPNAVLACITCHVSAEGQLRDVVTLDGSIALKNGYTAKFVNGATTKTVDFPGFKNSSICVPCHSGRTTEAIVKANYALNNYSTGTTGFYQHAANMGQTFIGTGAYQYNDANYANLPKHHTTLGMSVNTDNGPCATCHNAHSLKVDNYANCSAQYCHPSTFGQEDVERAKTNYDAAVKVLTNLVETKIGPLFAVPGTPIATERAKVYFGRFGKTPGQPADMAVTSKAAGAWYNWHILTNADTAAYAHNPAYARAILLDTIDFLDDGASNGSADATVATTTAITSAEKLAAKGLLTTQGCNGCHYEALATKHFANVTSATKASFITSRSECLDCHSKTMYHYETPSVNAQWAEGAHGATDGLAWTGRQWATQATCNACHTATGFRKFVASNFTDATAWATKTEGANETLSCKACHTDSSNFKGSVLPIAGQYVAAYGGFGAAAKATATYSNQGESNVCFVCHASRENGDSLAAGTGTAAAPVAYDFANKSFVNPHYLGSAGVWQGKAGFKFYTSTARYGVDRPTHGVKTADLVSVNHSFSDSNISGAATKGSCVACHLGGKNDHTFETYGAVKFKTYSSTVAGTGCLGCHSGSANGYERYYPTTTNSQFARVNSGGYVFKRALDMLKYEFQQLGIYFNNDKNAYFFTDAAYTTGVTNWTTQVAGKDNVGSQTAQQLGLQTMGAAMNLKLLSTDKGAAAHNAAFTKGIIADSLVFLQHGNVGDRSSNAAINSISFTAYSTAVTPAGGGSPADGNPASISNLKNFLVNSGTAAVPGARK